MDGRRATAASSASANGARSTRLARSRGCSGAGAFSIVRAACRGFPALTPQLAAHIAAQRRQQRQQSGEGREAERGDASPPPGGAACADKSSQRRRAAPPPPPLLSPSRKEVSGDTSSLHSQTTVHSERSGTFFLSFSSDVACSVPRRVPALFTASTGATCTRAAAWTCTLRTPAAPRRTCERSSSHRTPPALAAARRGRESRPHEVPGNRVAQ